MTKSKYTPREYTIAEAAYFAGLMDGEGTFFIGNYGNKGKNRGNGFFQTILKITNTDYSIIQWLSYTFGGWHKKYTPGQTPSNSRQQAFYWACTGDRLTHLCEIMLPYLVAKRDQALILIEMRKTYREHEYVKGKKGVQSIPDHIHNRRLELMNKLRALHCRNYSN